MISADEAIKIILESVAPCNSEEVFLQKGLGKYLCQLIKAPIDLPSFDHSAMDGYAVRSGDTQGATLANPLLLKVAGTIAAGDTGAYDLGPLGSAFRIMTGAMIPSGADAVIPFEETNPPFPPLSKGGGGGFSEIQITHPIKIGHNIRRAGEDVRCGDVVLEKGKKITSRTMALLAALGIDRIAVSRIPRVIVVSTGNELVSVGARHPSTVLRTGAVPLPPGKVHNSNGPALIAALEEIGISQASLVSSSDDERVLLSVLKEAFLADVVITIGGVSAGDFDHVPKTLSDLGANILFHKVAIKPGKPLLFALWRRRDLSLRGPERAVAIPLEPRVHQRDCFAFARNDGQVPIFALPGNPVSALMVFDRFVRPALLKMMGACRLFRNRVMAVATEKLSGSAGKEDYLRVVVNRDNGAFVVRSAGGQSAANLLGLACANAYAILPADRTAVEAGQKVEVEFFGEVP